jgi:Glycoside hydrolase family 44
MQDFRNTDDHDSPDSGFTPPGLKSFFGILIVGLIAGSMWVSKQYEPGPAEGGEKSVSSSGSGTVSAKVAAAPLPVWSSETPVGKTWGNDRKTSLVVVGQGYKTTREALTLKFEGEGHRGCGLNWKGWWPDDACDDVSRHQSLTFYIRQVTHIEKADLTVHLTDNIKRGTKTPVSHGLSVVAGGSLSKIDGEWRKVVLPLERFARNKELDLKRVWGIDFGNTDGGDLIFQIDRIAFTNDQPAVARFPATPNFTGSGRVDADRPGHHIRDDIYGVCELPPDRATQYGLNILRWGGNRNSRYNWKINADNAGKDWFYKNAGARSNDPAQGGWTRFALTNQGIGATSYLTVPIGGFVSKDPTSYAYSVRKYGPQSSTEMGHPDVGSGFRPDGRPITNHDWHDTSIEAPPEFIAEGVRFVVQKAGTATASTPGVKYWVLDNEPMLWHETHRDVRPAVVDRKELWDRTLRYAEAIKKADPTAKVAGFCSWGWADLFYSSADRGDDDYRTSADRRAHGGLPLAEWFIKQCGDYKKAHGVSLVDVFDFHWYPQAKFNGKEPYLGTGNDVRFNELRLRTTRDLWDATYQPESWTRDVAGGGPTRLIPRVREWIAKHNPGMELCIGEYNFGGSDNITGALAQADTFGILARERVDLAFLWATPEGTQELAWKLFRDYDEKGSRFGTIHVPASSTQDAVAVHAAKRVRDGAMTVVLINKSLGGDCQYELDLPGLTGTPRLFRFDQETGDRIAEVPLDAAAIDGRIRLKLPAASATLLEVR